MNLEKRVYSELYEILKNIDKTKVMKLPKDIIDKIVKNRDVSIPVIIDWNRPLESQNLHEDTINILGWMNLNYWTEDTEEKRRLLDKFMHNELMAEKL